MEFISDILNGFLKRQVKLCNYRPATYATRKGLEHIRKMLSKQNKLCTE